MVSEHSVQLEVTLSAGLGMKQKKHSDNNKVHIAVLFTDATSEIQNTHFGQCVQFLAKYNGFQIIQPDLHACTAF